MENSPTDDVAAVSLSVRDFVWTPRWLVAGSLLLHLRLLLLLLLKAFRSRCNGPESGFPGMKICFCHLRQLVCLHGKAGTSVSQEILPHDSFVILMYAMGIRVSGLIDFRDLL